MLTGSDLLAKFKEVEGLSDSEQCRACGYVSTKKNGEPRLHGTAYYKALLEAKGMKMGNNSDVGKYDEIIIISGYLGIETLKELSKIKVPATVVFGMYLGEGVEKRIHNLYKKIISFGFIGFLQSFDEYLRNFSWC